MQITPNSKHSGRSILHCCWSTSVEQSTTLSPWLLTIAFRLSPVTENAFQTNEKWPSDLLLDVVRLINVLKYLLTYLLTYRCSRMLWIRLHQPDSFTRLPFCGSDSVRRFRGHSFILYKKSCTMRVRSTFSSERVVNVWNNLPASLDFKSPSSFIIIIIIITRRRRKQAFKGLYIREITLKIWIIQHLNNYIVVSNALSSL